MQIKKHILSIVCLTAVLALSGCGEPKEKPVPNAMQTIERINQVRIGTDAVHLPFEFGLDTGVQGYDIDIGNEIAKDLGVDARWVKLSGYNHLFDVLKNGEVEMLVSAIAIDPARQEEFAFSQPYYESGDGIARRFDNNEIKDLASLSGKNVGVGAGRPGDSFMQNQQTASDVTIVRFPNLDDALGALNRQELNAVVGDEPILTFSGFKSYPNVTTQSADMNEYRYAVVVRKSDAELLASVNKTLDRLKASGELESMQKKWFQDVLAQAKAAHEAHVKEEELRRSPKRINVRINKVSGQFRMDRLDGFVLVLQGTGGTFRSTPILTEGNSGNCRFNTPMPPGDYKLDMMSIFKTAATVTVQEYPKTALDMLINVSDKDGIMIEVK
ncbi:MAG: amino acid ABC transporter substrate-binding protein [Acidobacteria bacterium]|nr:amino acid ABC transporter substrate-binding protein [Acidobacteriota bacterium]